MALRQVNRAIDLHSKHLNKTVGLTAPQVIVLQSIESQAPVTVGEIAKAISLGQATVTTIVSRLENRGYLYREKSLQDRRKVYVVLTAKGKEILASAPTPLQEEFIDQFESLEEWEQSMILSSIQRVAKMMDAQEIDIAPLTDMSQVHLEHGQMDSPSALEKAEDHSVRRSKAAVNQQSKVPSRIHRGKF
jgi:DNA-binding MarR family transcriptional regulator